jgi:cell shape-determining protein MreC
MKKISLAKRNSLLSSAGFSWGVSALVFACIVLFVRILAPDFFWYAFSPVFRSADSFSAKSHSFLQSFNNAATLAEKNEQLQSENATLADENQVLIQKIANITGLSDAQTTIKGILAGVVARPPESPYDTLVLSAGSNEGVTFGMEAFGAGGVPIGVVSTVLADFSRVTLFSAPNTNTSGWVGHTNIPVTLFGAGAGAMNASIARSANIVVGDMVFVSGPGLLPIGVVTRVDSNSSSPSVTLRIQPAINPFSISWVVLRDTGTALLIAATSTPLL